MAEQRVVVVSSTPLSPTIASRAFAAEREVWTGWAFVRMTPTTRRWWTCCAVSLGVHLVLLGFAALIRFSLPALHDPPQLDSVWFTEDWSEDLQTETVVLVSERSVDPGGRTSDGEAVQATDFASLSVSNPVQVTWSPLELASSWSQGDLLSPAGESRRSSGRGAGVGDGTGDGSGFFGIPHDLGNRIVYVVDNSLSMNHKHDSPAKTRFKRVQMELVKSIWYMQPQQKFYVIFFNRETSAMPARAMQPATPWAKEHYLTWVAETKTSGAPTDPRQAMELALGFQPDIIYFLTDGEFDKGVIRRLRQIRQSRTAIHTFAFGEKLSEGVLADIAKQNQGKYTYIP